jgi:hypothetical protein
MKRITVWVRATGIDALKGGQGTEIAVRLRQSGRARIQARRDWDSGGGPRLGIRDQKGRGLRRSRIMCAARNIFDCVTGMLRDAED